MHCNCSKYLVEIACHDLKVWWSSVVAGIFFEPGQQFETSPPFISLEFCIISHNMFVYQPHTKAHQVRHWWPIEESVATHHTALDVTRHDYEFGPSKLQNWGCELNTSQVGNSKTAPQFIFHLKLTWIVWDPTQSTLLRNRVYSVYLVLIIEQARSYTAIFAGHDIIDRCSRSKFSNADWLSFSFRMYTTQMIGKLLSNPII